MHKYKCVAIIGHDHCGSTVLCRALEVISGIRCAGEMHWVIDVPIGGVLGMRAGWSVSRYCAVHGPSCPVLDKEFMDSQCDCSSLYENIRTKLLADVVVSSDKQPHFIERYAGRKEILGAVLFKHPYKAVTSDVLTNKRTAEDSIRLWTSDYKHMTDWATGFCRDVVFVNYDNFVSEPFKEISKISSILKRDIIKDNPLDSEYHFIGGNEKARNSFVISSDDRWRSFVTDEIKSVVTGYADTMTVYDELIKRSNSGNP